MKYEMDGAAKDYESGGNLPPGLYMAKLVSCELDTMEVKGEPTEIWKPVLEVTEGPQEGRQIYDTIFFTSMGKAKIYGFLSGLGMPQAEIEAGLDTEKTQETVINRRVLVRLTTRKFNDRHGNPQERSQPGRWGYLNPETPEAKEQIKAEREKNGQGPVVDQGEVPF